MRCLFTFRNQGDHQAITRPIVIITSNSEKELPDPFLSAASSTTLNSDENLMQEIVKVHYPDIETKLMHEALKNSTGYASLTC
jgi:hypothetical protein